ncbi:hypothetical protein PJI16_11025 [Nitrospira sp. MA-1]|nr:hypothetical protein [Nitrospira sp. MA-1]
MLRLILILLEAVRVMNPFTEFVVEDAALVAMTLMIAESRPEEKDVLVRIVMHLLCQHDPL